MDAFPPHPTPRAGRGGEGLGTPLQGEEWGRGHRQPALCLGCAESPPAAEPPPRPPGKGAPPAPLARSGTVTLVPCPPAACPRGACRDIAIPHLALPRPPGLIYGGARTQSRPQPPRTQRQWLLRCILTRSRRQARRLHANGSQSQPGPAALGDAAGPLPGRWISALVPGGCSRRGGGAGCASANGDVMLGELWGTHRAMCSRNGAVRNAIPWGRVPSISKLQWEEGGTVGDGTKWPTGRGCVYTPRPRPCQHGAKMPQETPHTLSSSLRAGAILVQSKHPPSQRRW